MQRETNGRERESLQNTTQRENGRERKREDLKQQETEEEKWHLIK